MSFDLLVVGGAAGASWGGPAGWSAFVRVTESQELKKLVGAQEDLTLQRADLLAFAAAIQWYHNRYGVTRPDDTTVRVLCCTDSVYLARAGANKDARIGDDWAYIEWLEARGYVITWHWTSRDQCPEVYQGAENARRVFSDAIAQRASVSVGAGSTPAAQLDSAAGI